MPGGGFFQPSYDRFAGIVVEQFAGPTADPNLAVTELKGRLVAILPRHQAWLLNCPPRGCSDVRAQAEAEEVSVASTRIVKEEE